MESKHFSLSKINWVAFITVAIGALTAAQSLQLSPETMGYIVAIIGLLNFILRTFFTNTTVTVKKETGEFNG